MSAELSQPVPRPGILDIAAYVPGKEHVDGVAKVYKLSSNETPLGPSPKAIEAFGTAASHLEIYPDGQAIALRQAIADVHGLNIANIMCGNGSTSLLGMLCHVYLGAGDEAIITEHGFLVYKIQIMGAGATPVTVKEKDCAVDVDAILAAVTPKTKMVFVANPGNPTGTYVPVAEIRRLQASLPKHVVLVLDAAYAEYVRKNDYEAGLEPGIRQPQRGDDPHLLEGLWSRRPARRLDVWSRRHHRCAEPRARPIQHERAGHCCRCRCDSRSGLRREGRGA